MSRGLDIQSQAILQQIQAAFEPQFEVVWPIRICYLSASKIASLMAAIVLQMP